MSVRRAHWLIFNQNKKNESKNNTRVYRQRERGREWDVNEQQQWQREEKRNVQEITTKRGWYTRTLHSSLRNGDVEASASFVLRFTSSLRLLGCLLPYWKLPELRIRNQTHGLKLSGFHQMKKGGSGGLWMLLVVVVDSRQNDIQYKKESEQARLKAIQFF